MKFLAEKDVEHQRFLICKDCDRFVKPTQQCLECGCFMKFKTKIPGAGCPLGKW